MNRRQFLATTGVVLAGTGGCLGSATVLEETVDEEEILTFEVAEGYTLEVTLVNEKGTLAAATLLRGTTGEALTSLSTETEETATAENVEGGTYHVAVLPDGKASVTVAARESGGD